MRITSKTCNLVDEVIEKLNLQSYESEIYRYLKEIRARGYDTRVAIAVAVFIICRKNAIPLTITKICNTVKASRCSFFKLLKKCHSINQVMDDQYISNIVSKFVEDSKLRKVIEEKAKEVAKNIDSPVSLVRAVAAVYLVCKKYSIKVTQKELEELTGVTEVSIRNKVNYLSQKGLLTKI